jgi:hypothetical protein
LGGDIGWSVKCLEKNMPKDADKSEKAFRELIRILEETIQAGADCLELEWEDRELVAYQYHGSAGIGAVAISKELQDAVIKEIVKRASLHRKPTGKLLLSLLGKEYEVFVKGYDSYGESAFTLRLSTTRKGSKG